MRKTIFICLLICLVVNISVAFADPLTIADLIKDSRAYDGKRVVLEGEVIGHLMKRGEYVWFNINDSTDAIGIWTAGNLVKDIKYLGRHTVIGDTVKVEGVFHLRCPGHGGDTDIHADKITLVERGSPRTLTHDARKVNIIIFLTAILTCLYIIKILKRTR